MTLDDRRTATADRAFDDEDRADMDGFARGWHRQGDVYSRAVFRDGRKDVFVVVFAPDSPDITDCWEDRDGPAGVCEGP